MNQPWIKYLPTLLRAKFEGRTYLQNVVSNTGWQFADNIVRMGVGLVVGIWLARYLGPEQYGVFNYALAFVALFTPLASLGLDDIAVRDIVRDPDNRDETLGTSFILSLLGGALVFLAASGLILILRPDDALSHWLVGVIAFASICQAFYVIEFWFNSQVQAKYLVFARNGAFLLCAVVKIVLILSFAPLIAFAWVYLLEIALCSLGLIVAYNTTGQHILSWRASANRAKGLLRDSWPLFFTGVVTIIYMRIDQVMLGEMTGSEEVGIYSVAVRLAEIWMFIPMAIFWSVFPAIVEARSTSEDLMYGRLQQLYNLMAFLAYALAIPVTLLADWLVGTLFGEAYARAGLMLAMLIWANLFASLEIARSAFLSSMNWTRLLFVTVLLGALLNIALNFLLIPHFKGYGAVIATLIAYWFAAHGSCFLFRPLFPTGRMLTRAMLYPKIW
jgi:O-antigen/teichoic acid export membrane protein